jgi:hypothetical protein
MLWCLLGRNWSQKSENWKLRNRKRRNQRTSNWNINCFIDIKVVVGWDDRKKKVMRRRLFCGALALLCRSRTRSLRLAGLSFCCWQKIRLGCSFVLWPLWSSIVEFVRRVAYVVIALEGPTGYGFLVACLTVKLRVIFLFSHQNFW